MQLRQYSIVWIAWRIRVSPKLNYNSTRTDSTILATTTIIHNNNNNNNNNNNMSYKKINANYSRKAAYSWRYKQEVKVI